MAGNRQFGRPAKSAGFRRNPREHAGTGAIGQEKPLTGNGWGFGIGGGMVPRIKRLLKVRNRGAAGGCEPVRTQSKSLSVRPAAADGQAGFLP